MSLSTLQLASTSAFALLAGLPDATQAQSIVFDESALLHESTCANPLRVSRTSRECGVSAGDDLASHRLALGVDWKTKWTAADALTELLDVDGIRVVADRHLWDRPETLALRHDFASDTRFQLYCAAGIDRAMYLDSRALSPSSALSARRQRSVGMMAEVGTSWRLTGQLNVETDIHWMDLTRDARLMRTDAGWVSGDPVTLTLSLVWRGK
jgi:YD repeat-containing protein